MCRPEPRVCVRTASCPASACGKKGWQGLLMGLLVNKGDVLHLHWGGVVSCGELPPQQVTPKLGMPSGTLSDGLAVESCLY